VNAFSRPLPTAVAGLWLCLGGLVSCGGGGGGTPEVPAPVPLPAVDVSAVAAADPGSTLPAGWEQSATMPVMSDWYRWQATSPTGWSIYGGNPWRAIATGSYFAPFWDQMPDFNLTRPAVVAYHHDNLRFRLNRAVSDCFKTAPAGMAAFLSGVMGCQRAPGAERTLVLINYGPSDSTLDVTALPANAALVAAYPTAGLGAAATAAGVARIAVPAQAVRVFRVVG